MCKRNFQSPVYPGEPLFRYLRSAALKSFVRRSATQLAMLIRVLPHCLSEPASHMAVERAGQNCAVSHSNTGTHVGQHSQQDAAWRTYCTEALCKKQRGLINQQRNPDVPPTLLTLNRHTIVPPPISEH